jgi:hypothetical protein
VKAIARRSRARLVLVALVATSACVPRTHEPGERAELKDGLCEVAVTYAGRRTPLLLTGEAQSDYWRTAAEVGALQDEAARQPEARVGWAWPGHRPTPLVIACTGGQYAFALIATRA